MIDWSMPPHQLPDEELRCEYLASSAEATDARQTALAAEIEHCGLGL